VSRLSVTLAANLPRFTRAGRLALGCRARMRDTGVRALGVPTDVGNAQEMEQLARSAVAEFGCVDVWVNNAGAGVLGRF